MNRDQPDHRAGNERWKKAEEEVRTYRARLEAILDNMVDGMITIDESGTVQNYNKACEKMFGYTAEEVLGQNINMLMPRKYASEHDGYLANYRNSGIGKIIGIGREVEGQRKDGSIFPLDLSVAEVKLESRRFFSGIVRDISERKRAEEELRRTNKELEQFAYIASHDLKAPLRGIDNLAQWIAEDLGDNLPGDVKEKIDLLRGRVLRLEVLLDDILSYSRAGRIVDDPVRIETGAMVRQIAEIHMPDSFSLRMPDIMPVVISPRTPLEQVFSNLISNAVKHHDRDSGSVEVSFTEKDSFYEFSVGDDGPGIPEEFHHKAFQMFQTLKSRDQKAGSGLGMAIIKKLVEWQGGGVWIESKPPLRGTRVRFLWPKRFTGTAAKKPVQE